MKRRLLGVLTAIAVAMALAIPVGAAELHEPHQGTTCPDGEGLVELHFVNNQLDAGTAAGWIFVEFADGTTVSQIADRVNRKNQHWTITADGESELVSAETTTGAGGTGAQLIGMLVLSDFDCKKVTTTTKDTTPTTKTPTTKNP
jgi:hypothetical protein